MRKTLKKSNLNERTALALSLVVLLAAFGCTTNRNPGSGEPYIGTPGLRPTGTVSFLKAPDLPPPMTSSYTGSEALPVVKARSSNLPLTADQAAAVLRQQTPRVRVLGQSSPGVTGGYYSDGLVTGLPQNSAAVTNPQSTINSSLTSRQPAQAVTSGVGGGGGTVVVNASGTTTTQSASTVNPTNGSAVRLVTVNGQVVVTNTSNSNQ